MRALGVLAVAVALLCCVESQFITFKDGRLGVNFGGYHAGVGLGGVLGGGTAGGLFAEAGTPQGPAARAGLGGVVDDGGRTSGGLYAGATAGGNVKASAGLAGGVEADRTAGAGYAAAQAGEHAASSGLGGETSGGLASGFTFGASKSFGGSVGVVKESEVQPFKVVETVQSVPVSKKIHHEFNFEAANEVKPFASEANIEYRPEVPPPVVVKEVYVPPPPVVEKTVIRTYRPRHKASAYIGGYVGGGVASPATVVHQAVVAPAVQKRVDLNVESAVVGGADTAVQAENVGQVGYTKTVSVQRNPQFFADIFNIPIQTLRAVGNFLGNTAGGTSVSVEKTASVQAGETPSQIYYSEGSSDADRLLNLAPILTYELVPVGWCSSIKNVLFIHDGDEHPRLAPAAGPDSSRPHSVSSDTVSPKHASSDSLSSKHASSDSSARITIDTSPVSKIIDDIFAIPINTLGAVNKFLENNIPARKRVQVTGDGEPTRIRLGPHARRRAHRVTVVEGERAAEGAPAASEGTGKVQQQ